MATDVRSLPAFFNTDADFQAWVQGLQAQFAACGLVKTSDTGQINSATVLKPAAANTAQGYEIYRFSDAAQASLPLYLKVEYGSSSLVSGGATPGLWVTVGTGSSGAGAIEGGSAVTRTAAQSSLAKSAGVTLPSYCSGDGGRLALVTNYDWTTNQCAFAFVIDRLRDALGNASGEGTLAVTVDNTPRLTAQVILAAWTLTFRSFGTGQSPFPGARAAGVPLGSGQTIWGAQVGVTPLMATVGQLRFLVAAGYYNSGDTPGSAGANVLASALAPLAVKMLGRTRQYLFLPSLQASVALGDPMAILWE